MKSTTGYFDCHTHAGIDHTAFYRIRYPAFQSATTLIETLERNGISNAIVFPLGNTLYYDIAAFWDGKGYIPSGQCSFPFEIENKYLLAEIRHFGYDNLYPFCCVSLKCKIEEQVDYLNCVLENDACYGIKLHSLSDHESILKINDYPMLLDFISKNNLPIICHTSIDEYSHPMNVLQFARQHPNIRVCAAHAARFQSLFFSGIDKSFPENLYFDISPFINNCRRHAMYGDIIDLPYADPYSSLTYLIDKYGPHVLFATDSPCSYSGKMTASHCDKRITYEDEISLFNKLPNDYRMLIAHDNPLRYLFG